MTSAGDNPETVKFISSLFTGDNRIVKIRDGMFIEVIGKGISLYPKQLDGMRSLGYELFSFITEPNGECVAVFERKGGANP